MGLCKGNRGNLMQHWTLAEVFKLLKGHCRNLHIVTTHSMAPWAIPERVEQEKLCRRVFRAAGKRLTNHPNPTAYESAWKLLSVFSGLPYPSTAAFVTQLWAAKQISISLCEFDSKTADEIEGWLSGEEPQRHFSHKVLLRGDWRASIQSPHSWNDSGTDCLYVEMDPMRYDASRKPPRETTQPNNLYPEDLELLCQNMPRDAEKVVLQISSFNTQNNNMPLDTQLDSMSSILSSNGFALQGQTRVGMQMASFVFSKGVPLGCGDLNERFVTWLGEIQ